MAAHQALATAPARHTVEWYELHKQARQDMLRTCQNDHSLDPMADCLNATSAAHGALADSLASSTPSDPEADPAYYGKNRRSIAIMLSLCDHNAAPQTWCSAAHNASAALHKQ